MSLFAFFVFPGQGLIVASTFENRTLLHCCHPNTRMSALRLGLACGHAQGHGRGLARGTLRNNRFRCGYLQVLGLGEEAYFFANWAFAQALSRCISLRSESSSAGVSLLGFECVAGLGLGGRVEASAGCSGREGDCKGCESKPNDAGPASYRATSPPHRCIGGSTGSQSGTSGDIWLGGSVKGFTQISLVVVLT